MTDNTLEITFSSDGYQLHGVLHLPIEKNPPVVVGSHGLASDGDSPKQIELARACNRFGIAYFRFHHRGCGISEGVFSDVTSLENRRQDLLDAVKTALAHPSTGNRLALVGSSMGGTSCIFSSRDLHPEGYVIVAAPVFGNTLTKPPEETSDAHDLDESFYERFLSFDMTPYLPNLSNVLIFHGDKDDIVPIKNGQTIYDLAAEPKRLIVQKNGDHRISDPKHQEEFIRESSLWFKRCFFG